MSSGGKRRGRILLILVAKRGGMGEARRSILLNILAEEGKGEYNILFMHPREKREDARKRKEAVSRPSKKRKEK